MVYACRICTFDEIAENKCVYRNDRLVKTRQVGEILVSNGLANVDDREQVGVTADLGTDPTLVSFLFSVIQCVFTLRFQAHSNIPCPNCGNEE
jgi:DNA-directed RNA polymerase II subunit RPB9